MFLSDLPALAIIFDIDDDAPLAALALAGDASD